ncbi:MAG TPA: hypothetical protein VFW65_31405 [Pseudonocardiaceae bacterium]|nr:hypothetical protein [Pseudonocardiaceae bacterium]
MTTGRPGPALEFWLSYLDSHGGLWELSGDTVLAVLPEQLAIAHDLPESGLITDDPDIAREDGVLFLGTGHPEISKAAETVIDAADVGTITVPHRSPSPTTEDLLGRIRDQVPVDHGRIDATGAPIRTHRSVLRLGVLVSHTVSAEERFTEVAECMLDVPTRVVWPEDAALRLRNAAATADQRHARETRPSSLTAAVAAAHRELDAAAGQRGQVLAAGAAGELVAETARVGEYYAAALAVIDKRRAGADERRTALLDARAQATIAERDRRLAEVTEKYQRRHELRPYRLHLIDLPVWRLATDVRRGDRRWPVTFDYLPLLGTVAPTRCPACDAHAPLVATKTHLGCATCVPAKQPAATSPATTPTPKPAASRPPATSKPGEPQPRNADQHSHASMPRPAKTRATKPTLPATTTPRAASPARLVLPGKAEERKVADFWNHVGAGDHRRLNRLIAPESPLAALTRLYLSAGPLHGIGIPAGQRPVSVTCDNYDQPVAGRRGGTAGAVQTNHREYPYLLLWSPQRLLDEILPYGGPRHLGVFSRLGRRASTPAPPTHLDLDPVAVLLHTRTTARYGLAFTARALAAWWRLPDPDDLLARFTPQALAATIDRAIRYWSGAPQATYAEAADAFRTEEATIRKAAPVLQKRLQLSDTRNW